MVRTGRIDGKFGVMSRVTPNATIVFRYTRFILYTLFSRWLVCWSQARLCLAPLRSWSWTAVRVIIVFSGTRVGNYDETFVKEHKHISFNGNITFIQILVIPTLHHSSQLSRSLWKLTGKIRSYFAAYRILTPREWKGCNYRCTWSIYQHGAIPLSSYTNDTSQLKSANVVVVGRFNVDSILCLCIFLSLFFANI
jgi:hypothetical protein